MSSYISYCYNQKCPNKKCERHISHIKDDGGLYSFMFFTDCVWWKDTEKKKEEETNGNDKT